MASIGMSSDAVTDAIFRTLSLTYYGRAFVQDSAGCSSRYDYHGMLGGTRSLFTPTGCFSVEGETDGAQTVIPSLLTTPDAFWIVFLQAPVSREISSMVCSGVAAWSRHF